MRSRSRAGVPWPWVAAAFPQGHDGLHTTSLLRHREPGSQAGRCATASTTPAIRRIGFAFDGTSVHRKILGSNANFEEFAAFTAALHKPNKGQTLAALISALDHLPGGRRQGDARPAAGGRTFHQRPRRVLQPGHCCAPSSSATSGELADLGKRTWTPGPPTAARPGRSTGPASSRAECASEVCDEALRSAGRGQFVLRRAARRLHQSRAGGVRAAQRFTLTHRWS